MCFCHPEKNYHPVRIREALRNFTVSDELAALPDRV